MWSTLTLTEPGVNLVQRGRLCCMACLRSFSRLLLGHFTMAASAQGAEVLEVTQTTPIVHGSDMVSLPCVSCNEGGLVKAPVGTSKTSIAGKSENIETFDGS